MKFTTITTTNIKGQIVIPAAIRAQLGITDQVPLQITVKGNSISIEPVTEVLTASDSENSYLDILKKTKGTWKDDGQTENDKKELELQASKKRKAKW